MQNYDSSLFIGQSYFFSVEAQPYLIFYTLYYTLRRLHITIKVRPWESKGLSSEKIVTLDNNLSNLKCYRNSNFCLVFKESCLKQDRANFTSRNVINIYIVYELDTCSRDLNTVFTKDCIKNADPDQYGCSGFDIGFDSCTQFSLRHGNVGKNVIIFRVNYELINAY